MPPTGTTSTRVVDYIRALRRVDKVSLLAWSLGGPRAGGYAAQHPGEGAEAGAARAGLQPRRAPAAAPAKMPPDGVADEHAVARRSSTRNWDRQVGCPAQYEPAVGDAVWSAMLASDPVGATWGPACAARRRRRRGAGTQAMVGKTQTPTLMVAGQHDKQVAPDRVRELYADLAAPQKLLVDLACSSHNAMWEKNRLLMFQRVARAG